MLILLNMVSNQVKSFVLVIAFLVILFIHILLNVMHMILLLMEFVIENHLTIL